MAAPVASSKETLAWVLETSKRQGAVPVHNVFLQARAGRRARPGPLARFVTAGRARTLDLYLLALLRATKAPYNVALPAGVWARALGMGSSKSAATSISKHWRWLAEQRLIARRGRHGPSADIGILREDGSGDEYLPGNRGGQYFSVPFEYWSDNWFGKLDLPAKATLLIALSLLDDFYLPHEKGPSWYGLSADTVGRGLASLKRHELLSERTLQKPAAGTSTGFTRQHHYTLQSPFGPQGKRSRDLADAEVVE